MFGSEQLYFLIERLQKVFNSLIIGLREPLSEKDGVILLAAAKADKTLNAILFLCQNGFGEDATILSRSLFEIYWNLEYIFSIDDNSLAKRFFDYDWVVRKEMYDYIKDKPLFQQIISSKDNEDDIIEVEKQALEMNKKYNFNKPFGWAPISISGMTKIIGHSDIYKTAYKIQCSLSHFNPRSSNEYFKEDGGFLLINAGASNNLVDVSLHSSAFVYLMILKKFNSHFSRGFEKDLDLIEEEFIKVKQ